MDGFLFVNLDGIVEEPNDQPFEFPMHAHLCFCVGKKIQSEGL